MFFGDSLARLILHIVFYKVGLRAEIVTYLSILEEGTILQCKPMIFAEEC